MDTYFNKPYTISEYDTTIAKQFYSPLYTYLFEIKDISNIEKIAKYNYDSEQLNQLVTRLSAYNSSLHIKTIYNMIDEIKYRKKEINLNTFTKENIPKIFNQEDYKLYLSNEREMYDIINFFEKDFYNMCGKCMIIRPKDNEVRSDWYISGSIILVRDFEQIFTFISEVEIPNYHTHTFYYNYGGIRNDERIFTPKIMRGKTYIDYMRRIYGQFDEVSYTESMFEQQN